MRVDNLERRVRSLERAFSFAIVLNVLLISFILVKYIELAAALDKAR